MTYEQPLVSAQSMHLYQEPLRTMMLPQPAQVGASSRADIDLRSVNGLAEGADTAPLPAAEGSGSTMCTPARLSYAKIIQVR
jgi:hypothetical protein